MEEQKINILQLIPWLSKANAQNSFLMKPNDMKMLYLIFLWEYINKYHSLKGDEKITSDKTIALPERDVINLVQKLFDKTLYQYFNSTFNM